MTAQDIEQIAKLLNVSIPFVCVVIVFVFCISNIDKLLLLLSKIQSGFSFCSHRARKGAIANSIRGKMMKSTKAIRSIGEDLIIPDLKIDWIKDETPDTFVKNNKVVIRLKQGSNPHKNFATAVNMYVNQGLLPKAHKYIDEEIFEMSKLSISRLIIINGDMHAIDYFEENYIIPVIEGNESCAETYQELKTIDKNGMFINILLNEYVKAAYRICPDTPDPLLIAESREFLSFLYRIATRDTSENVEMDFNREYFKVSVMLAARSDTYLRGGITPYLKHISECHIKGDRDDLCIWPWQQGRHSKGIISAYQRYRLSRGVRDRTPIQTQIFF